MSKPMFGIAGALLAGCVGTTPPDAPDGAAHLVASVPQPNGNLIELYEVSPGELIVSEAGTAPTVPLLTAAAVDALSTRELFAHISDNKRVPPALEAALQRQQQLHDTGTADPWTDEGLPIEAYRPARLAGATASGSAACSASWFASTFCNTGADYNACKTEQTVGQTMTKYDVVDHSSVVCATSGTPILDVGWRPWFSWTYASWDVPAGTYRWWRRTDSSVDFDVKSSVLHGSTTIGYQYHYEGVY